MKKPQFHDLLLKQVMKNAVESQDQKFRAVMKHIAGCEKCFPLFHKQIEDFT